MAACTPERACELTCIKVAGVHGNMLPCDGCASDGESKATAVRDNGHERL
jgi:hypothetical protein